MPVAYEPACRSCNDSGLKNVVEWYGQPMIADGKAWPGERCETHTVRCHCQPMPESIGVTDRLKAASFDNFDLSLNPTMKPALDRCRAIADGSEWCGLLVGSPGLGKSHLAAAALAVRHGHYWSTGKLLLHLRHLAFDDYGPHIGEEEALRPYCEGNFLLVLDDMGAEKLTEWANQTLYAILNARYESKLPTIITTNMPFAIDERLLSRYYEGAISCTGQDVRRIQGGKS